MTYKEEDEIVGILTEFYSNIFTTSNSSRVHEVASLVWVGS